MALVIAWERGILLRAYMSIFSSKDEPERGLG
jgi:hypothetical protein